VWCLCVCVCVCEGTAGCLFFEFYRILTELRAINPADRPLFWLYENVSSMQLQTRQTISRFFKVSQLDDYIVCAQSVISPG